MRIWPLGKAAKVAEEAADMRRMMRDVHPLGSARGHAP